MIQNIILNFITANISKVVMYSILTAAVSFVGYKFYDVVKVYMTQEVVDECVESTIEKNEETIDNLKKDVDKKDKIINAQRKQLDKQSKAVDVKVQELKEAVDTDNTNEANKKFNEVLECFEKSC